MSAQHKKDTGSIRALIGRSRIKEALELMEEDFPEYKNEITVIKADFHHYQDEKSKGIASDETIERYRVKVNYKLLELVSKIEENEPGASKAKSAGEPSILSVIVSTQLKFLKRTIKKISGTKNFLIGLSIAALLNFGGIFYLMQEYMVALTTILFIAIIVLIGISIVILKMFFDNQVDSFRQNREYLKQHHFLAKHNNSRP